MSVKDTSLKYNTLAMCLLCQGYALPWKLPDTVDAEDREDAIVAAVKRGHRMVIVSYRRVSEGLNLQIIDTVLWFEMAQHLILLTQASQRAWRLGKQEEVRIFYLAYTGTVSHDKLKQLASQGGAAALFSGNAPQGGLAEHVGAERSDRPQRRLRPQACRDGKRNRRRPRLARRRARLAARSYGVYPRSHTPPALAAASCAHATPHQRPQTDLAYPSSARAGGAEGCRHLRQPRRHRQGAACRT